MTVSDIFIMGGVGSIVTFFYFILAVGKRKLGTG